MEIDVSPEMGMYKLLESYPYDLVSALSEYIDNAIQAFDEAAKGKDRKALKVTIDFDVDNGRCQKIRVIDDGPGIAVERLSDAMKPAHAPAKKKLSEFGIGMKAASIWLGKKWTLTTFPEDGTTGYRVLFDLDELIAQNSHTLPVKEFEKEPLTRTGVELQIKDLRAISEEAVQEAVTQLHDVYQIFLYRRKTLKFQFLVNGAANIFKDEEPRKVPKFLKYPDAEFKNLTGTTQKYAFKIGKSKDWDKEDFSFKFNGQKVSGRLLIRDVASQKLNPGLVLFRYGRMIKGSATRPYRPSELLGTANKAAPSKIYMELHLDGYEIDHTKGQFTFDEKEFLKAIASNAIFKKYLDQAEKHRATYEKKGQVIAVATSSEMENWLSKKRDELQAEREEQERKAEEERKQAQATAGNKNTQTKSQPTNTGTGNTKKSTNNNEAHNEDWVFLLPDMKTNLPHAKTQALVHEAKRLELSRCYAASMLFRTLVERALMERLTLTRRISEVRQSVFDAEDAKGRSFTAEQKGNFRLGITDAMEWVLNNREWFPEGVRRDAFHAAQKFKSHLKDLNGIVHEGKLTNSGSLKTVRDDSFAFLEFLLGGEGEHS